MAFKALRVRRQKTLKTHYVRQSDRIPVLILKFSIRLLCIV